MATLKDTSALASLNEQDYLNKLYEDKSQKQSQTLTEGYNATTGALEAAQGSIQQQTAQNIQRTNVEADKATERYQQEQIPKLSEGASAQAALSSGNQQQKNVNELQQREAAAREEIERQRKLEGEQYAAAIKQAQANNDMERAQALYESAKAEDAQWLSLKQNAATLMSQKGDNSIMEALLGGTAVPENASGMGSTWDSVLKYEDDINSIYDAQAQAELAGLESAYLENVSDIDAQQKKQQEKTDEALTDTYVNALRSARNEAETSTAYGRSSGTAAQARLARDNELRQELTDLRSAQADADANFGMEEVDAMRSYRDQIAKAEQEREKARVDALYTAAEQEEQNNLSVQELAAQQAAAKGDYELLGAMYGLTADQVDRLMRRGKYAPKQTSSGVGGGGSPRVYTGYGNTTVYDYSDGKSSNPGAPSVPSLLQWADRHQYK
jgi:hypothetical protein